MREKYILLIVVLCVTIIGKAQDFMSGGFVYTFGPHSGEVMVDVNIVDGLNAYAGVCIIPEKVNYEGDNYKVTAIAEGAFAESMVTEVVIPNSVTQIGSEAFLGCDELKNVTLSLNIEEIPRECFLGTGLVNIAIPEGVTRVGYAAFEDCYHLHTVMLPSSLKLIEAYAFADCHNLYEIYCASVKPPKATGWSIFNGVKNVDVIVSDYEAMDAYAADKVWGDEYTFTLFPNEDIWVMPSLNGEAYRQDWERVSLGNFLAYKVIDENDELIAVTAADNFYLPALDHDATYTIVPTTMMGDSYPVDVVVERSTGVDYHVDNAFPADPEPIIVAHEGTLYIYGDNYNKWVSVWDMSGRLYYKRISSDSQVIDLPRNRVYVVRVGNFVKKIFI
ncbi:MAG: leucine-rich repeat domain-containing protein [Muribaculaceae bacterium]|nr:leucine-rich repeat domain-containing protein [Muribaculaceae bacterium]